MHPKILEKSTQQFPKACKKNSQPRQRWSSDYALDGWIAGLEVKHRRSTYIKFISNYKLLTKKIVLSGGIRILF